MTHSATTGDIEDLPAACPRMREGSCAKGNDPGNCERSCENQKPPAVDSIDGVPLLDVVIVGAGVIGCAIARRLSSLSLRVAVLEKGRDVASGASKANSGIVHGGYDELHGTLKSRVARLGNSMFAALNNELNFGFRVTGSLVLAFSQEEVPELERLLENGLKNGVKDLRIIDRDEILKLEPHLNPHVYKALRCPHTGITSPYEYTIALAENAIANGVQFHLGAEVTDIQRLDRSSHPNLPLGGFLVRAHADFDNIEFYTKHVVNAAGLFADKIAAMLGAADFSIIPRKGEYIVLDKTQAKFANHVLFPVPNPTRGKGILVSQTFHGNLLLGPTSRDVREDARTNNQILSDILHSARMSVPGFDVTKAITSYAGLRAKCSRRDFIVEESPRCPGLINVAGIDSPGLTASPAVAQLTAEILQTIYVRETGQRIADNRWFNPLRPPIIIKKSPTYKGEIDHPTTPGLNIICRCETVSEMEIVDAIHRPLGAHSTDAVKKRTRAGMGQCQGSFCEQRVVKLLARELSIPESKVPLRGVGSSLLPHRRVSKQDGELLDRLSHDSDIQNGSGRMLSCGVPKAPSSMEYVEHSLRTQTSSQANHNDKFDRRRHKGARNILCGIDRAHRHAAPRVCATLAQATVPPIRTFFSASRRACAQPECNAPLPSDATTACGAFFFCDRCAAKRLVAGSYFLPLVLTATDGRVVSAVAFHGVVIDLIGIEASLFDKLCSEHTFVIPLLETHLTSLVCRVILSEKEKQSTNATFKKDDLVDVLDPCSDEFVRFADLAAVKELLRVYAAKEEIRKRKA
ncbi:hypothetical protein HDU84_008394 [Entophlyctis sp. JEL0112]|nr:hypothetical protein HDU84_008394 [Entophlyctis sp. JEL0112]